MKRSIIRQSILILIVFLVITQSCQKEQTIDQIDDLELTEEIQPLPLQTQTSTELIEITPSVPPTATEVLPFYGLLPEKIQFLDPGEYLIVYGTNDPEIKNHSIFFYFPQANELIHLSKNVHLVPHTNDGKVLTFSDDVEKDYPDDDVLLDLNDPQYIQLLPKEYDYRGFSYDARYALVTYERGNFTHEIAVYDIQEEVLIQLTYINQDAQQGEKAYRIIGSPAFSPDGKWISFLDTYDEDVVEPEHGLYLMNTACLEQPESCEEMIMGPFWTENLWLRDDFFEYSWSPDSTKIAMEARPGNGEFLIFDIETKEFETRAIKDNTHYQSLCWSPDGRSITFIVDPGGMSRNKIYQYDLDSGEEKVLETGLVSHAYFALWIVIE